MTNLDKSDLHRWLLAVLDRHALAAGKIDPPFEVVNGRLLGNPGWQHIDTAASPIITIDSLEAAACRSLAEFLRHQPGATNVAREVDRLLIKDTDVRDGGLASSFGAAFHGLPAAAIAVLTPDFPQYGIPAWARSLPAPPIFTTDALAADEVLFIHPSRKASYLIEPIADIVPRGPNADLCLKAAVAKPRNQSRVPMTRFKIV